MERNNNCPVVLYTAPDGTTQLDVKLENETVWLTREQMAMLFDVDRTSVLRHIRNAFREGELIKEEVWAKFAHTTRHVLNFFKEGELEKEKQRAFFTRSFFWYAQNLRHPRNTVV